MAEPETVPLQTAYILEFTGINWRERRDSNPRPPA
jgi:hypothetical protein